jgi:hypothetical protein
MTAPPRYDNERVTADRAAELTELLKSVGIQRSQRYYQVGMWRLAAKPFAVGRTWQDHLAEHRELPAERRRARLYLVESQAASDQRASVERAARRELTALHGIEHPNIVRVDALESHQAGPALIYRYDPRSLRLDQYLAAYGDRLTPLARVALVRQLAEALSRPRSPAVPPRCRHSVGDASGCGRLTEDQRSPRLRSSTGTWPAGHAIMTTRCGRGTAHVGFHQVSRSAATWPSGQPEADPIALTSSAGATARAAHCQPPATDAAELLGRLRRETACGRRRSAMACRPSPTSWRRPPRRH